MLDDITISSSHQLDENNVSSLIKEVIGLFKKYNLRVQNKKTKVSHKTTSAQPYDVTGLWVGHSYPKLRKSERRYIRQLVFECEKKFAEDPASEEYHKFWHHVLGQVAKMQRLKHTQAKGLRARLAETLPTLDLMAARKLEMDVNKLLTRNHKNFSKYGDLARINRAFYYLGILSRTEKRKSRRLRRQLKLAYPALPTKQEYWL